LKKEEPAIGFPIPKGIITVGTQRRMEQALGRRVSILGIASGTLVW